MSRVSEVWGVRHVIAGFKAVWHRFGRVWDSLSLETLVRILVISLVLSLGVTAYSTIKVQQQTTALTELSKSNRKLGDANRRTLKAIKDQTSPEALAQQQRTINAILVRVDCNTRQAFQDAIQQLVDLGITEAGSIRIVTAQCEAENATTTTTSTVPGN